MGLSLPSEDGKVGAFTHLGLSSDSNFQVDGENRKAEQKRLKVHGWEAVGALETVRPLQARQRAEATRVRAPVVSDTEGQRQPSHDQNAGPVQPTLMDRSWSQGQGERGLSSKEIRTLGRHDHCRGFSSQSGENEPPPESPARAISYWK